MTQRFLIRVLLCTLAFVAGCAAREHRIDPDAVFRYGEIQFDDARGVFILTAQSLERNDVEHDLVIDPGVKDQTRICVEVRALISEGNKHGEVCLTVEQLRRIGARR